MPSPYQTPFSPCNSCYEMSKYDPYTPYNDIGFVTSNIFCYILNRLFVFKPGRHHVLVEFLLFFAVSGISAALGTAIQTLMITQYGVQTTFAFGANIICALVINYAMRKFVIFKG